MRQLGFLLASQIFQKGLCLLENDLSSFSR